MPRITTKELREDLDSTSGFFKMNDALTLKVLVALIERLDGIEDCLAAIDSSINSAS